MAGIFSRIFGASNSVKIANDQSVIGEFFYNSPITIGTTPEKILSVIRTDENIQSIKSLREEIVRYRIYIRDYDEEKEDDLFPSTFRGKSAEGVSFSLIKIHDELAIRQLTLGMTIAHNLQNKTKIDDAFIEQLDEARNVLEDCIKNWSIVPKSPFGFLGYQSDLNLGIACSYLGWVVLGICIINKNTDLSEIAVVNHKKAVKLITKKDYMEWKDVNFKLGCALRMVGIIKNEKSHILEAKDVFQKCLSEARELFDQEAVKLFDAQIKKCQL